MDIPCKRYLAVDGAEGDLHDEGVDNAAADSDKVERVPGVFEKILFVRVNGGWVMNVQGVGRDKKWELEREIH